MVYPETKSKSVIQKITSWIPFFKAEKDEELVIPHHDLMQKKCLQIYLEKHQNVLYTCELSTEFNIIKIAEDIVDIFNQLFFQPICHVHWDVWRADSLPEVSELFRYCA